MATNIDFTNFTFSAEQIRNINELIFDEIVQAPEITLICTIYPGIVFDKEIGFIGEGGLVGMKNQGCNPTAQEWLVGTRKVTWEPKSWEILIDECWTDLESTAAVYALKNGTDVSDLVDTDYETIILQVLVPAIKKFIIRLVWFSDTDAENVTDGGVITDGVDVDYFNILDGLFKQLLAQVTVNAEQRVAITENAEATYAAQKLTPANVRDTYLPELVFGANPALRSSENAMIICTQSFYDAYLRSLQGFNIESTYTNLISGQKVSTYNGIPIIPMPIWDEMIGAYEDLGAALNQPHRAIYVTKDVLAVGVDGEDSFEKMRIWYENKERVNYIELMGKADAKLLNPAMFKIAI